jgi:hypothetical protein
MKKSTIATIFPMEEAIKMLNMLLYADLELESEIRKKMTKADFQPYMNWITTESSTMLLTISCRK